MLKIYAIGEQGGGNYHLSHKEITKKVEPQQLSNYISCIEARIIIPL